MTKYKLKAETTTDVARLLTKLVRAGGGIRRFAVCAPKRMWIDIIVTFESTIDMKTLLSLIRKIPDGHVMHETVAVVRKFTGERTYSMTRQDAV